MSQKNHLSIGEFSRLTGITRPNLRFYDEVGLLRPESRSENGYRFYTRRQLNTAYLIVSLRELDIGLEDIRAFAQGRTPQTMLSLFRAQEKRIQTEIAKLHRIRKIMQGYMETAREALRWEGQGVRVAQLDAQPLFLGPALASGVSAEEASIEFYDLAAQMGLDLACALGSVVAWRSFDEGDCSAISHFYFRTRSGKNADRPAGRYCVAYGRCAPGETAPLYRQIADFAAENALRLDASAYEEFPIDELSTPDEAQFRARVEIRILD